MSTIFYLRKSKKYFCIVALPKQILLLIWSESEVENVDIDNLGLDRRYDFLLPLHLTSQTSQAG